MSWIRPKPEEGIDLARAASPTAAPLKSWHLGQLEEETRRRTPHLEK
jgi:hypothetical protein